MNPSVTTNKTLFDDFAPHRFEKMVLELLHKTGRFVRLNHVGAKGSDGGVDIYGKTKDAKTLYCQVKCVVKTAISDVRDIVKNNQIDSNSLLIYVFTNELSSYELEKLKNK